MSDLVLTKNKYLSDDEEKELLRILKLYRDRDPRNCLMLEAALHTGARPQELLNVRPRDLDATFRTVFLMGIKGSRDREVPIPGDVFMRLMNYAVENNRQKDERIFQIKYNAFGDVWRHYRPVRKTLRSLRHTFGVKMYRRSKDPRIVQKLLGHKYLSTTEVYLDFEYDREAFRALVGE